jgi:FkbM family methyltransferase
MSLLRSLSRKINTLTLLLENPKLIPLRRYGVGPSEYCFLNQSWFKDFNFSTIIDIGSNQGQFALMLNAIFPDSQLYCFEPIPDCFEKLLKNTSKVKNLKAFNIGLGDRNEVLDFNLNDFSASSSFLEMSNLHTDNFPFTKNSQVISVPVERLDSFVQNLDIKSPLLIKVDVQGFEQQVILGGLETFTKAQFLIIETSFSPLYEKQSLFDDIYAQLHSLGFRYHGSLHQMISEKDGIILQADSLFVKDS